ncbi:MAG: hypothetical protein E6658_10525 [Veillonella sp.]|nr:hypothetical protein [Veillonella sp.]
MGLKKGANVGGKSSHATKVGGDKFHPKTADPLGDVEYTDSLEEDSKRELTAMEAAYRERAKNEEKRKKYATDSEHWVAICFSTREDKEAWIKSVVGDFSLGDKYINGYKLATAMGVDLADEQ